MTQIGFQARHNADNAQQANMLAAAARETAELIESSNEKVEHGAAIANQTAEALGDPKNVVDAFYKGGTNAYLVKPVERVMLLEVIRGAGVQIEPCWSCVP